MAELFRPLAVLLVSGSCALAQSSLPDAGRLIQQGEARLGAAPGMVVLSQPSRLGANLTLGAGHGLRIEAPLTVGKASIQLAGHNEIRCEAPITAENATDLFVADGVTDVSVRGCDVTVAGQRGGYLLTATRAARVVATDNHLVNMAIFNTHNPGGPKNQTTDVTITGNSTEFTPGPGGPPIGVYLMYVLRATVANNRFRGTGHGIEWWGGDSNAGWRSAADVTNAGNLSITGNECSNAGGSCVWGSMGFDITVSGNTAEFCGDVCFDTEGGVRNLFIGNTARACGNGCYAAEFESMDATFTGNLAYADAEAKTSALVLIKHPSGRGPNHVNLTITGNTLTCGTICAAFYSEGEDGLVFANNTLTNAVIAFTNYTNSAEIRSNTLRFTQPLGTAAALGGPLLANGHRSEISENTIVNEAPGIGDASCIGQAWADNNSTDEMRIERNTCIGFPHGIVTETAGHNAGAPHAVWILNGNGFSDVPEAQQLIHRHTSGNEIYTAPK
ncbi:MAG: hypothetical protein ACRYFU_17215 [Janthinobacterium lividum]